jgi:hypothetical protein
MLQQPENSEYEYKKCSKSNDSKDDVTQKPMTKPTEGVPRSRDRQNFHQPALLKSPMENNGSRKQSQKTVPAKRLQWKYSDK